MTEVSTGRRKLGFALIATSALALPMTASISYARPEAPGAPLPPQAPIAPESPAIESIDPDDHQTVRIEIITDSDETSETRQTVSRGEGGAGFVVEGDAMDEAQLARLMAELEQHMDVLGDDVRSHMAVAFADARSAAAEAQASMDSARRDMPLIEVSCNGGNVVARRELENGRQVRVICQSAIQGEVKRALGQSIEAIRSSEGLSPALREEIIIELEGEIEGLRREEASLAPRPPSRPIHSRTKTVTHVTTSTTTHRTTRADTASLPARLPVAFESKAQCDETVSTTGAWDT